MKIKEILRNIFSIEEYSEVSYIMRFLGFKIKFQKRAYANLRKQNSYYYYKKNNIDITTIPPAEGQTRLIQLSNLKLLQELDYVCKENGLKYWLDFGTAIGAVRHKGFVPWDDDIDTGMMRNDYNKIVEAFKKSSRDSNIYAEDIHTKNSHYIKVMHRQAPSLFVDIFPYDFCGEALSEEERKQLNERVKKLRKKATREISENSDAKFIKQKILEATAELNLKENSIENSDVVWGFDYEHKWKTWVYSYDTVFPLKQVLFENMEFPCMNNVEKFLTEVYGDYMAYPKKIGMAHNMYKKMSEADLNKLREIVSK